MPQALLFDTGEICILKIGLYMNQKVTAGGGFQEAINAIGTFSNDNITNIDVMIFTSLRENLEYIEQEGYTGKFISLHPIRRLQLFIRHILLSLSYKLVPGNTRITYLIKKIIGKYNYFEKFFIKEKVDLIYFTSPDPCAFYTESLNYIITLWDLAFWTIPEFPELREDHAFETRDYYYSKVLPRSYACLVGHGYAKKLAVNIYNIPDEKVFIIPFKASKFLVDLEENKEFSPKIKSQSIRNLLDKKYVFYPAQYWAHKNHIYIIDALQILSKKYGENVMLVCSGSDKGNYKHLEAIIEQTALTDNVAFMGFLSSEELYLLYKNALAVVMPTYLGPASLPTLEAFHLGVPVIYPNFQHFRRYYGDGCLYIDLNNPSTLANNILELINSDELRNKLIKSGRIQYQKILDDNEKEKFLEHILAFNSIRRTFE